MIARRWVRVLAFAPALAALAACRQACSDGPGLANAATASHEPMGAMGGTSSRGLAATDAGPPKDVDAARSPYEPTMPGAHTVDLPQVDSGDMPPAAMGIAPGEEPGSNYPAGTVYLARSESDGMFVSEWDLARRTLRRRVKIDLADGQGAMFIRRVGDALHVLAWAYNGLISYIRLTTELDWVATTPLGQVSAGGPAAIAADENVAAVLFDGLATVPKAVPRGDRPPGTEGKPEPDPGPHEPSGLIVASFDAHGRAIAKRIVQRATSADDLAAGLRDNAIVRGGKIFVLLRTPDPKAITVLRLTAGLGVEETFRMMAPAASEPPLPPDGLTLFSSHDRIFIHSPLATEMIELRNGGSEMRRVKTCLAPIGRTWLDNELGGEFWMGREHVILDGPDFIEWSSPGAIRLPDAPCPGSE